MKRTLFIGVQLLDIYMGHQQKLPTYLKEIIKNSLIRAAESIQKRSVGPGYTPIALMGMYNLPDPAPLRPARDAGLRPTKPMEQPKNL